MGRLSADGKRITVYDTEDAGHNWNGSFLTRSRTNLNGEWVYLGRGKATIAHQGNRVRIKMTWTASSVPAPHYDVDAILSGNILSGTWTHLSAKSNQALLKGGRFKAKVSSDGKSLTVYDTEDNGHNWNRMVFHSQVI